MARADARAGGARSECRSWPSPTGPATRWPGSTAANGLGVDVIECDVHEYRGRLEVRHLKTAGPLPLLWDRWELASASAPRLGLDELLEADEHGTTFMLDIKGRRAAAAASVARFLHHRGHHGPVLVCGRWWHSVETVARAAVRATGPLGPHPRRARPPAAAPGGRVLPCTACRSTGRSSTLSWSPSCTTTSAWSMTWAVNDLPTLDAVLAMGATGIISDEPTVLTELLSRRTSGA